MTLKRFNRIGFTLIEIMAVVIILGVIATITTVTINYTIHNSKEKLYDEQISRLKDSAKSWSINNADLLPTADAGIVFFSIDRLKDEGIIDAESVIDPRSNLELTGCLTIQFNDNYKQYTYNYLEDDCSTIASAYEPVITVVGGDSQFTEVNGTFIMPIATAQDNIGRTLVVEGPVIKKGGLIKVNIDTSLIGDSYTLTYQATDERLNLTKIKIVTITVNDTIPPTICVGGNCDSATANFEASASFVAPVATVTDNSCGLSGTDTNVNDCVNTLTIAVTSSITPQVLGTYNVTYTAEDSSHNVDSLIVAVTVIDTIAPLTPTYSLKLNTSAGTDYSQGWTNQNVWLGNLAAFDTGSGIASYQYSTNCSAGWTTLDPTTYSTNTDISFCIRAVDYGTNASPMTARLYVKVDKIVPTCVSSGTNATWTNANRTLTGTCNDAGGSGCASTTITKLYSTEINSTVETPGNYTFTDNAGNVGSGTCPFNQTVKIDKTAPTCSASNGGNATWTNATRVITGTCSDPLSGCLTVNPTNTYSTEINTTTATPTPSAITFTDNAGNSASSTCPANQTVRIDKTAPTCAASGGVGSWTNQTVTLVGTCSDALSGCATNASTTYSGDTFNNSAATGNVSDNAGNATACAGQSVYVDKTAPSAPSANLNGYASGSWTNGNVTTTLSSSDALSGVASYQYTHDQANFGAWPYNPWTISWDGQWSFWARAIDAAGNVSGLSSLWTLRIDKTGPTITSVSCPRCGYWVNAAEWNSYVYWTATDGGVGISQMQYSINQGTAYTDTSQPSGNPSSFSSSDTYNGQYAGTNFYLRAVDALGNIGPWAYVGGAMYRDTSYPVMHGTWSINSCSATTTVSSVTDATSGLVASSYLRYTGTVGTNLYGVAAQTIGCNSASCTITWQARDNAGNIAGIAIKGSGCLAEPSSGSF